MNVASFLTRSSQRTPDHPALLYEGVAYSYAELEALSGRLATALQSLGVSKGARVALFLPNIPAFILAYFAIQKLGAIATSLNVMLKQDEVTYALQDCEAGCLITTPLLLAEVPPEAPETLRHCLVVPDDEGPSAVLASLMSPSFQLHDWDELLAAHPTPTPPCAMAPDDPAAIVYTSGTTGFPKGATLSHRNLAFVATAKERYCAIRPEDRLLLFLPLFHCFGQNAIMLSAIQVGATLLLHRRFRLPAVLDTLQHERVTMFFAVPTIYITLLNEGLTPTHFPAVRYYFSAAATLPEAVARAWQARFDAPIYEGYGLTESAPFASYNHIDGPKPGSIGKPIEQVEMAIVDSEGHPLPPGERGEIVIRGPNVMLGYWGKPEATALTLRDGWLHSGDVGTMDAEGFFYIVDRLKDMVNVSGFKIYPAEVERVLYHHPAIHEAAVYGYPDPVKGEQVKAKLILKAGQQVDLDDLARYCREQMAAYKVPHQFEIVSSLPKNPSGKILRRLLREQEQAAL